MFGVPLYPTQDSKGATFPTSGLRRGWDGRRQMRACGPPKFHLVLICPLPGVPHCSLPRIRCCSLPLTLVAPSLTVSHPSALAP